MTKAIGLENVTCVQAANSERIYPPEMLNIFAKSLSESTHENLTFQDDDVEEKPYDITLCAFLEKYNNPLFVMLKPCWELFGIDKKLLEKLTVAAYGSFNFRCLMEKYTDRAELARFFNSSFKRVVLYETFFVMGEDNSINLINAPHFYEMINKKAQTGNKFWVCNFVQPLHLWCCGVSSVMPLHHVQINDTFTNISLFFLYTL
jgi:hypothetical protein